MARTMILELDLPKELWAEVHNCVTYLKNRFLHAALQSKSLIEAFVETKLSIKYLHFFGQKCYVYIYKKAQKANNKFDVRAMDVVFVGYIKSKKIYKVYIPKKCSIKEVYDITFAPFHLLTSGGDNIKFSTATSPLNSATLLPLLLSPPLTKHSSMNDMPSTKHLPVNDTSLTHLLLFQQIQSILSISLQMQIQKQNLEDMIVFIFPKLPPSKSIAKSIKPTIFTTTSQWMP